MIRVLITVLVLSGCVPDRKPCPNWKRGEVVQLKSGGPNMVISGAWIESDNSCSLYVKWMSTEGEYQYEYFDEILIKRVNQP
jgi:uncharacterized protein YodC (DUF2158 family)